MSDAASVHAVVVTYNRKALLLECLEAIADQTHPVTGVTVVDNASTDGTLDAVLDGGVADRMPVDYLRLTRNGGGAEGFHYGVKAALASGADWIWLMDDDCEPVASCLADLLASPPAGDPGVAMVAPLVTSPEGEVLPLNRGWVRPRWFRAPLVGLSPADYERGELDVDHVSLVGPLVRASAAARVDPPRREFFIWFDDLEWCSRLRRVGRLVLITAAEIVHKDPRPMPSLSLRARWRDYARGHDFGQTWKRSYGLRNLICAGRAAGFVTPGRMLSYVAVAVGRSLLFESHRLRSVGLIALYARDGWRGVFRNLPPDRWASLATDRRPLRLLAEGSLRYDTDVDTPSRPLSTAKAATR